MTERCIEATRLVDATEPLAFGIPGRGNCASIERMSADAWRYCVVCRSTKRQVRGEKATPQESLAEMVSWLRTFECPGHLPGDADLAAMMPAIGALTPRQGALRRSLTRIWQALSGGLNPRGGERD